MSKELFNVSSAVKLSNASSPGLPSGNCSFIPGNFGLRKGNLQKMMAKFINEKNMTITYLANRIGTEPEVILKILKDYEPEINIQMAIIRLYCETKWH